MVSDAEGGGAVFGRLVLCWYAVGDRYGYVWRLVGGAIVSAVYLSRHGDRHNLALLFVRAGEADSETVFQIHRLSITKLQVRVGIDFFPFACSMLRNAFQELLCLFVTPLLPRPHWLVVDHGGEISCPDTFVDRV